MQNNVTETSYSDRSVKSKFSDRRRCNLAVLLLWLSVGNWIGARVRVPAGRDRLMSHRLIGGGRWTPAIPLTAVSYCLMMLPTEPDFSTHAASMKLPPVASLEAWFQYAKVQFRIKLCRSLVNLLGITLQQTTAYNPAANGRVKRFHLTLKAALISRCKDSNLFIHLPCVLLELKTTLEDYLDVLAAGMVYGNPLVVPAECFPYAAPSDNLQSPRVVGGKFIPKRQTHKPPGKQHIPTELHLALHVFLQNDTMKAPLTPPYMGPFLVICGMSKPF
ncbi:uncharacterized protein [Palaemon carinicauda]|uniref:uncharacterized protein n=1 Tax=Palaemon carinicauda TaxID=392227 RepID=UPI0035B64A91